MIGPVLSTPMMLASPAPLEDGDDDPEGGADAEQVHHDRLQRHQHRAEDDHQQQRREQDDDADEERQLFGDRVAEVLEDRGDAADVELGARSSPRSAGSRRCGCGRAGWSSRRSAARSSGRPGRRRRSSALLKVTAVTAATPSSPFSVVAELVQIPASSPLSGSAATIASGPLKPAPKPSASRS